MDDNTRKLKAWRDGVSASDNCLSLDALRSVMEGGSFDPNDAQHVSGCAHCQAELAMLRSFESSLPAQNDQEVNWIAAQLRRAQNRPVSAVQVPFWRSLWRVPQLVAAAAFVLMIGLGLSLYISNRQEPPSLLGEPSGNQGLRSGDIRLGGPSGDLGRAPEDFRWEAAPLATSYSIQLLEVDGTVLWSGQSAESVLIVGPELKMKMMPGKALLWKVTALDASGKPIASSSTERFRVTAAKGR